MQLRSACYWEIPPCFDYYIVTCSYSNCRFLCTLDCVHGTQEEPGNETMSTAYLHLWCLFMSMYYSWMWQLSRNDKNVYPSELQVGHSNYSYMTYWPLKLLTWFYFTIYVRISNPSWIPDFFRGFISHSRSKEHHYLMSAYCRLQ